MSVNKRRKILSQGRLQQAVVADAQDRNIAPARVMRWVSASAFFEFLNRAEEVGAIDAYLVKGGFAVELRHPAAARTSEDIDLVLTGKTDAVSLLESLLPGTWDSFVFTIKSKHKTDKPVNAVRIELDVQFNGVHWGTLKLDVLDADIEGVEFVNNVDITKYQLPRVTKVACMSRPQQLSEWVHCTTRPLIGEKRRNRAKNIIDIYVFTQYAPCDDAAVVSACEVTFAREATHTWPPVVEYPADWIADIEERLAELDIEITAEALVETVSAYIGRLANGAKPKTLLDEFRSQVASEVEAIAASAGTTYVFDGQTWRRGVLSITVGEDGGRAFVAYVAPPNGSLGHRSLALPFSLDRDGARQAAAYVADCLDNPYLQ